MKRFLLALFFALPAVHAIDFTPLEQIPIQEGGRKKPYVVFADEALLMLTGATELKEDAKKRSSVDVITTLWLEPKGWDERQIIRVNHKPLKDAVGLDATRKLFSYRELAANEKLAALLQEAASLRPRAENSRLTGLHKEASDVGLRMARFASLASGSEFRFVANPEKADGDWLPASAEQIAPLRRALEADDNAAFASAAKNFQTAMASIEPQFQPAPEKIRLEATYQKLHPFRLAWWLYAAAGLVLLLGSLRRPAYIAAWVLAGAGFLFQVAGFAMRITIAGRAPVTNMYESVVWVAFGTIFFALLFEAIYRSRMFLLGAVPVAVGSLILADTQLVALNRSISPLVPVLRDNFWLTTHVLTITLSYAAFLLALGIGHIVLGRSIFGHKPSGALHNYLYRVLQVGVLLLATGTILGAVWANYSWGRFWDWDPKETWALVTLLGYLFLLHGRIAGKWGGFGMAVGSVICFLCVLMAWYGVNFVLGAGLHSYGFGSGGFGYAACFVVVELAFVAVALLSRRKTPPPAHSPAPAAEKSEQLVS